MGTLTLRPNDAVVQATTAPGLTGAATHAAAAADTSDGTFSSLISGSAEDNAIVYHFPTPAVPAGARIMSITPRLRHDTPVNSFGNATVEAGHDSGGTQRWASADTLSQSSGWLTQTFTARQSAGEAFDDVRGSLLVRVRNKSAGGSTIKVAAVYLDVTYNYIAATPTVTPSGDIASNTITVTASYSDAENDALNGAEFKLFTDAAASVGGFDPTTATPLASAWYWTETSWNLSYAFENGTAYRLYARVRDFGSGQYSPWGYSTITANITKPLPPTFDTIAAQDSPERISVFVRQATQPVYNTSASQLAYEVERSGDGGATWEPMPRIFGQGATHPLIDGSHVSSSSGTASAFYDYEAHRGDQLRYRARTLAYIGSDSWVYSDWTVGTPSAFVPETTWQLKSPYTPADNTRLHVGDHELAWRSEQQQGHFVALGRKNPILLLGTIGGESVSVRLTVLDEEQYQRIEKLRAKTEPLLLQSPYGDHRWVRFGSERVASHVLNTNGDRPRTVAVRFIEQDPPA